jgi:GT2 family glycosyltransferase
MSPKVTVLIASYLKECRPHLDLALRSIEMQTHKNVEVVLTTSGHVPDPFPEYSFSFAQNIREERLHYPAAIAEAYKFASPDTEFLMLLNDDAFLSATCIERLILSMGKGEYILNPLCQCDQGMFFEGMIGFRTNDDSNEPVAIFPSKQYSYKTIAQHFENIVKYPRPQYIPFKFYVSFAPLYATLMRKSTWEKLGGIDVRFRTGQDDWDVALRAEKHGIKSAIEMSASAFHFSGTSTSKGELTTEDRLFNRDLFHQKHGFYPF